MSKIQLSNDLALAYQGKGFKEDEHSFSMDLNTLDTCFKNWRLNLIQIKLKQVFYIFTVENQKGYYMLD